MNVVEMRGITKKFGDFTANDSIDLIVKQGEIHALLGENGAGKSTLMNILFGLYQPTSGEIYIKGQKVAIRNPNDANQLGIGMVHQHFKLVEPFTVTENIILGSEPRKWFGLKIDYERAEREVRELSERYGLQVDPTAKVRDISVGMQQRVEILKTLYRGADIIIFDEPTAVLTPQEIQELMQIMRNLIKEGKSIILITHKLKEIMEISDTVTIIRRGKMIDRIETSQTDEADLAAKMVGRQVSFTVDKQPAQVKEPILVVDQVYADDNRGIPALEGISFEVHAGEILGIAGVDGNGQSELIDVLTGLRKAKSGQALLKGQNVLNEKPRKISEGGIGHIPEDRQKRGLVLNFTVAENMVMKSYYRPTYNHRGFIDYGKVKEDAKILMEEFDVRPRRENYFAKALSGGNQQKVIIAREVNLNPDLLIAAQPTRGLDVGAIEYIHQRLVEQRDHGKAVLLLSLELDEIFNLSDRIAVIFEGKIVGIVDPKETTQEELGLMMAGGAVERKGDAS